MRDNIDGKPELFPQGTHTLTLHAIEGKISHIKNRPYIKLAFYLEGIFACHVMIVGSWDNIIAWRYCIGKSFEVKVNHKKMDEMTYIDARVIK